MHVSADFNITANAIARRIEAAAGVQEGELQARWMSRGDLAARGEL